MQIIGTPADMRAWSAKHRAQGESIGLVPTMGALHEGHASLLRACAEGDDARVMSLFVNPAQFAPHEDLDRYPRTWDRDLAMAEELKMDAIYAPSPSLMYPKGYATYVEIEGLQDGLCGITRPHFFRGVATVVAKLLNAVTPDRAYFGQKDAQQCAIIRRMVRDLDLGVTIVELPIMRDDDGLATSSRNAYLDAESRHQALALPRALSDGLALMRSGERAAERIVEKVRGQLQDVEVDYVALVDPTELTPVAELKDEILLAAAIKVGETRLIDNLKFTP